VVLAGLEEHAVAGADDLDRAAAALAESESLGDEDGLAERVGVPCGPRARGWTLAAATRDGSMGVATVSMKTRR
jgi:hypothetical protein